MSKRTIKIIIDAEDKYCGECIHRLKTIDSCKNDYCEQTFTIDQEDEILIKKTTNGTLRCPACLSAEVKE